MNADPFGHALILTGPTASGKSRLGVELARRLGAEIVSMDSMALYRRMDIGTAKPGPGDRQRVPHHLIDVLEPWESANVAWWREQAGRICREIEARDRRALFVGGTPLYLKALLEGLFEGPPGEDGVRRRLEQEALDLGPQSLHARLASVDPATAGRLHPNDVRRVVRALEVWELTGKPISSWQQQWKPFPLAHPSEGETLDRPLPACPAGEGGHWLDGEEKRNEVVLPPPLAFDLLHLPGKPAGVEQGPSPSCLCLDVPRQLLYERINARVEQMMQAGLLDEVRSLRQLDRPLSREARQALGYKELLDHLEGRCTLEEAVNRIQTRSRQFAKRQLTWFRHIPQLRLATEELTFRLWGLTIEE